MNDPSLRFPAEWEAQSSVLVAWPHAGTDWADRLDQVESTYVALAQAVTARQSLVVCVADAALRDHAATRLQRAGVDLDQVRFVRARYDDTWLRDSGPISLVGDAGYLLLDFRFTGWGGKFQAGNDDQLVAQLMQAGLFQDARSERVEFALEGGAIETDGAGTLLSTWHCLSERHPGLSPAEVEAVLGPALRQSRFLWLRDGHLEGDDTDAHIDTLARFAAPDAIVHQGCDDPDDSHHAPLAAMAAQIAAFRDADGRPYRTFELPWPAPILDQGRRLAASYANFLIVNGAVLMPAYDDPADVRAAEVLAEAFPGREIVPVPCRPLIWQNGSLHCITMQLPAGLLRR